MCIYVITIITLLLAIISLLIWGIGKDEEKKELLYENRKLGEDLNNKVEQINSLQRELAEYEIMKRFSEELKEDSKYRHFYVACDDKKKDLMKKIRKLGYCHIEQFLFEEDIPNYFLKHFEKIVDLKLKNYRI